MLYSIFYILYSICLTSYLLENDICEMIKIPSNTVNIAKIPSATTTCISLAYLL